MASRLLRFVSRGQAIDLNLTDDEMYLAIVEEMQRLQESWDNAIDMGVTISDRCANTVARTMDKGQLLIHEYHRRKDYERQCREDMVAARDALRLRIETAKANGDTTEQELRVAQDILAKADELLNDYPAEIEIEWAPFFG